MYLKTPTMTLDDGIRPSQEGTAVAKDVWLVGAGLTLLTPGNHLSRQDRREDLEASPSKRLAAVPLTGPGSPH